VAFAQGDSNAKRVAYVTVLEGPKAESRIAPVRDEVDRLWLARTRTQPQIEWKVFRYVLPAPLPKDRALSDVESAKRKVLEDGNQAELSRLKAWGPHVVYAPGASAADAVEKAVSAPVVVGCKCYPKGTWKLTDDLQKPTRRITGFSRYFLEEKDVPASAIVGTAENRKRGAAFSSLHAKRLEYLRLALGKRKDEWMTVLVLHGEKYDRARWDYRAMARERNTEWVEVFLEKKDIGGIREIFEKQKVAEGPRAGAPIEAGLVLADTFLDENTEELARATSDVPVPVIFPWDEARYGAWMHFGTKMDVPGKAAQYIVNVLVNVVGGKDTVADYPIDGPKEMELGVNRAVFARWKRAIPPELVDDPVYEPYPLQR
jgi:hypothetical protein